MVDTSFFSDIKKKAQQFYKSKRKKVKKFLKNNEEIVDYLKEHLVFVLIYGFIVNYAFFVILDVPFNLITLPGWGFAFYLFKEEIPEFIRSCKYGKSS